MDRRSFLSVAGCVCLAGCAGIGNSSTPTPEYDVGMRSSSFVPREIEVATGDLVTWRNTSSRPHTVTAYDGRIPEEAEYFASGEYESESAARDGYADSLGGAIYTNETYEHTFEVPGTYDYVCIPHEAMAMVGRVIVTE